MIMSRLLQENVLRSWLSVIILPRLTWFCANMADRQLGSEVYFFAAITVLSSIFSKFCSLELNIQNQTWKNVFPKIEVTTISRSLQFVVCMWREGRSGTAGTGEILRGDNLLSVAWEPHRDRGRIAGRSCSAAQTGRKKREITRLSWLDFNLGKCRGIVSSIVKKCNVSR